MSLNTIAWILVLLFAVVLFALLTAQDHDGGDH